MKNTFNHYDSDRITLLQKINHSDASNKELESFIKFVQKKAKKNVKAA
jgi:hypothetical protein